jgi:hypothetical protein
MGFTKLMVSSEHVSDDKIEDTYRRWLKADAAMGDPKSMTRLEDYHKEKGQN